MDAIIRSEKVQQAVLDLAEKGWAVIPGVLSAEACDQIERDTWAAMFHVAGVRRDTPSTWVPLMRIHGIVQAPESLYHCKPVWEARKAVAPYFAELYQDGELASSFDRICVYPEPGARHTKSGAWLHTDQSPLRDEERPACIQGFVDLRGTGPLDGGLVVADKSHLAHRRLLLEEFKIQDAVNIKADTGKHTKKNNIAKDWYKFTDQEEAYIYKHFNVHKVECPRGSLVIWDSKTIHQNTPPKPGGGARFVIYTCMQPWRFITDEKRRMIARADKLNAYTGMRGTSHWPLNNTLFTPPRTYGKPQPEYKRLPAFAAQPDLDLPENIMIARLVGYKDGPAVEDMSIPVGITQAHYLITLPPKPHLAGRITCTSVRKALAPPAAAPKKRKRAAATEEEKEGRAKRSRLE